MRSRPDAGRTIFEGLAFGERQQILHGLHGQILAHHKDMFKRAHTSQRRKILDGIIARLAQHKHIIAMGLVIAECDRQTIRFGTGHLSCAQRARCTRHILHNNRLPQGVGQITGDKPRNDIGRSACGIGDNQTQRPLRLP